MLGSVPASAALLWLLGEPFLAPPAGCFLALHFEEIPTAENQINGWAGGDRVLLRRDDFGNVDLNCEYTTGGMAPAKIANTRAIQFGVHVNSQTPLSFALWDAATGGSIIFSGGLEEEVLEAGNPPIFLVGELVLLLR